MAEEQLAHLAVQAQQIREEMCGLSSNMLKIMKMQDLYFQQMDALWESVEQANANFPAPTVKHSDLLSKIKKEKGKGKGHVAATITPCVQADGAGSNVSITPSDCATVKGIANTPKEELKESDPNLLSKQKVTRIAWSELGSEEEDQGNSNLSSQSSCPAMSNSLNLKDKEEQNNIGTKSDQVNVQPLESAVANSASLPSVSSKDKKAMAVKTKNFKTSRNICGNDDCDSTISISQCGQCGKRNCKGCRHWCSQCWYSVCRNCFESGHYVTEIRNGFWQCSWCKK